MKLLLDQNLSHKLCARLADVFPGSVQARLIGMDQSDDTQLWQHAKAQDLVIVTQDVDFVNMSLLHGHPPKIIWLRCGNQPSQAIEKILRSNLIAIRAFAADHKAGFMELFR